MNAAVLPPTTVPISDLMAVLPVSLTVEACDVAGLRTFGDHGGAIMLGHVEPGRSGGDARVRVPVVRTLKRAALRSFSEVIHTVPSSSCT